MGPALGQHLVPRDDLGDPRAVPQVEEGHSAVIAPTGNPARERDSLAGVVGTQRAGLMGAEHERFLTDWGKGQPAHPTERPTPHTNGLCARRQRTVNVLVSHSWRLESLPLSLYARSS